MTGEIERPRVVGPAEAFAGLLAKAEGAPRRFPSGFAEIDRLGTPEAGDLTLIWARSSCGKTTFAMNVVARTPEIPTLIVSLEMPEIQIYKWLYAMMNLFPWHERETEAVLGGQHGDGWRKVALDAQERMVERLRHVRIAAQWPKPPTVDAILRECDEMAAANDVYPERIILDHVGLMAGCREYEGMGATQAAFKRLAVAESMSVWLIQQTGRTGDTKSRNDGHLPVTLSSGVYAGEQDCDFLYGLYRPDKDPKFHDAQVGTAWDRVAGKARLQIVKNRQTGVLELDGIWLDYDAHSRRYAMEGERYSDIPGMEAASEPADD